MSQQDQVTKKLDKLARMVLAGVSQVQIAAANGLTEGRVSQILNTKEYKQQEEVVAAEKYEEMELINQGWDGVESLGVQNVLNALQTTHDPDFALRAAAVANKASRRGGRGTANIQPQNAGGRAIIHLKATFVQSLQQNFTIQDTAVTHVFDKQKDSDFMPAKDVQVLLGKKVQESVSGIEQAVEQAVTGFGIMQEVGQEV